MQANRKIHLMFSKKHLFACFPVANLALQTYEETSGLFLWHHTGGDFSSRNTFTNLGSFAKVSFSVETVIPWFTFGYFKSCAHIVVLSVSWQVLYVCGFAKERVRGRTSFTHLFLISSIEG